MKHSYKCDIPSCHYHIEVTEYGRQELRKAAQEAGVARAGLICPRCVKLVFENPEGFDLDVPLGEMLIESLKDKPSWRILVYREEGQECDTGEKGQIWQKETGNAY